MPLLGVLPRRTIFGRGLLLPTHTVCFWAQFPDPLDPMLHLDISHHLDALLADEPLWNALAGGVPFRETSWLAPWWRHFGAGKEAFVLIARDDQNTIRGLLPLYRCSDRSSGRTLSMIGDGDACSDYASVLAAADDAVEVAREMGRFLAHCAADHDNGWDMISIDGVVEGDRPMAAFASALKASGGSLHAQSRMSTWFKPTDASWDDHLKHFGKTQRRKMRRWSEKIDSTPGLERLAAQSPEQVDELLDAMIALHQRRWTDAGQLGTYADPAFREFVRESAHDFFRRDRLYLPAIAINGRVIGGELHLVGGNRQLYCYSSGYDIDSADLEPGRILCVETLLHLYRGKLAGIDYLRGDEPYKERMAATPRRVFHFARSHRPGCPACVTRPGAPALN